LPVTVLEAQMAPGLQTVSGVTSAVMYPWAWPVAVGMAIAGLSVMTDKRSDISNIGM
jgi:hypothetical protein